MRKFEKLNKIGQQYYGYFLGFDSSMKITKPFNYLEKLIF